MLSADEAATLIEAIAARQDRAAFAALFRHFAPRVKSFVMRFCIAMPVNKFF